MNGFYETGTLTPSITRKNAPEEVKYLLRPQQMSVGAEIQTQTCWLFSSHSFHCAHSSLLVPRILDHMKVLHSPPPLGEAAVGQWEDHSLESEHWGPGSYLLTG